MDFNNLPFNDLIDSVLEDCATSGLVFPEPINGSDFVATQITFNRREDGSSPSWPLDARQFLTPIHVGMEDAPRNRSILAYAWLKNGNPQKAWLTIAWLAGWYICASPQANVAGFTHWCELPGDPT